MPIWKIVPIDPDAESWAYFQYRDAAIVRAEDAPTARQVAAECLSPLWPGLGSPTYLSPSPWQDEHLSACQQLENSEYPEDGPPGLLYPTGK
jgi:hypothetical protein